MKEKITTNLIFLMLSSILCAQDLIQPTPVQELNGKVKTLEEEIYKFNLQDMDDASKYIFLSKKYYEFNEQGDKLHDETIRPYNNTLSAHVLQFHYDNSNQLQRIVCRKDQEPIYEQKATYEGGRIISVSPSGVSSSKQVLTTLYFYRGKNEKAYKIQEFDAKAKLRSKSNLKEHLFEYDSKGRVLKEIVKNHTRKGGDFLYQYEYDEHDRLAKKRTIQFNPVDLTKIVTERMLFHQYDAKGQKKMIQYSKNFRSNSVEIRTFNAFKDLVSLKLIKLSKLDFLNYDINDPTNLLDRGAMLKDKTIPLPTYKLDEQKNWVEKISIDKQSNIVILHKRKITYF